MDWLEDKKLWIFGIICAVAGMGIGLLIAPITHGISVPVFSNNAFGRGKVVNGQGSRNGIAKNNRASRIQGACKKEK